MIILKAYFDRIYWPSCVRCASFMCHDAENEFTHNIIIIIFIVGRMDEFVKQK